jgi:hypothetical protein
MDGSIYGVGSLYRDAMISRLASAYRSPSYALYSLFSEGINPTKFNFDFAAGRHVGSFEGHSSVTALIPSLVTD